MDGLFDVGRYLHTVPEGCCLYHGIPHSGGTLGCTALKKMYTKAALNGKTNIPLASQLQTTRPIMQPPPMPHSLSTNKQAPKNNPPIQRPSAHHTAVEEDLEEINIDEIHDTINDMLSANNVVNDNSNKTTDKAYSHSNIRCSNSTFTTTSPNAHKATSKILVDSGATHNMINNPKLFHNIEPWRSHIQHVTLADGMTKTPIKGFGTIHGTTSDGTTITIPDCLYVPQLNESLLSTKYCSRTQGFFTHTENGATIISTPAHVITCNNEYICKRSCN